VQKNTFVQKVQNELICWFQAASITLLIRALVPRLASFH